MLKSISSELSESVLQFAPGGDPVSFDITVYNSSDQFASFQVALVAAGADANQRGWYRLSPSVSAKIPPGDQTQFKAHILSAPPVPGGFTGSMNLTARVYSTELRDEDRKDLRLIITGEGLLAPKITLPKKKFKAHPQEQIEVRAKIYNPNRKSLEVVLELAGLESTWLPEGVQKSLTLAPSQEKEVLFPCELPSPPQAPSGVYPFSLKILQPEVSSPSPQLLLEVFPKGFVEFQCDPLEQWLPENPNRWFNPRHGSTEYTLTFDNQSNVRLAGTVSVVDEAEEEARQKQRQFRLPLRIKPGSDDSVEEADAVKLPDGVTLDSPQVFMEPGESGDLTLTVHKRLPWFGWARQKRLQVEASLVDAQLDLRNEDETLELNILPVIPVWLQLLAGLAGLCLIGALWILLTQRGHTKAVHTVQFNGAGTEAVSGSSDQTIRRWRVRQNRLEPKGVVDRGDEAVRVIQYRPVNNNWVAAGLENGVIQVRSLLNEDDGSLVRMKDDRVFDLAFDQDARTLWSAHGSGLVLNWALTPNSRLSRGDNPQPIRLEGMDPDKGFGFALSAITLGGSADNLLAVGGRYQKLVLLDLISGRFSPVVRSARIGTQTEYINSLEIAEEQPTLLAAGDTQGFVSLWNMEACLSSAATCEPLDEWLAHGGDAVRSVALSSDGCYLVSAGDDGRVRLWFLTRAGKRSVTWEDRDTGQVLRRSKQAVNAVDILQRENQLLIVSGGDDRKVRLNRVRLRDSNQCRANR
ncbi:MAG: WD40 repeat domain-containing protein [Leptolyngbyaceae cyanobacterium MO_188.B28]|nr:WD40 repeat domain-containing protein [Leptolyngbyaceae cyanobacterium MO_188.B28]